MYRTQPSPAVGEIEYVVLSFKSDYEVRTLAEMGTSPSRDIGFTLYAITNYCIRRRWLNPGYRVSNFPCQAAKIA